MDVLTLCFRLLCSPAPGRGGTLPLFALQNVNNLSRASFSAVFESLLTECENVSRIRCSSHGTVSYWISYSPKYKQESSRLIPRTIPSLVYAVGIPQPAGPQLSVKPVVEESSPRQYWPLSPSRPSGTLRLWLRSLAQHPYLGSTPV